MRALPDLPDLGACAKELSVLLMLTTCIVTLWACVMFIGLQVDRGNLAQAISGTLLKDLKLSTNG